MTGKAIRQDRLFSGSRNAVIIAIDHGEFNGPLPGMVNLEDIIENIDAGVSGILISPGMITQCGRAFGYKGAPMAIVRLNWSTHFVSVWDYRQGIAVEAIKPGGAMASGADIALACLTLKTGSETVDAANVRVFTSLVNEAKAIGMPIIGEYFPANAEDLSPDELHNQVYIGCRITAELGADMIKTFYTNRFAEIVNSCPIPIFGLGAEKAQKQIHALELAEKIVQDGGRGVVFGRNALQATNPILFQKALIDVVQNGISAAETVHRYGISD